MATVDWYVRTGGNNLNAGGQNSDTPRVNGDASVTGVVVGAVFTDVTATFVTAGVLVTDAVNLAIAGVPTIVEIQSVDSETQITFTTSPGDGTYAYRVGGARAHPAKVCNTGAGLNARLTAGDSILIQTGTYSGFQVAINLPVHLRGQSDAEWTVDGTGLGAGSDPISGNSGAASILSVTNAVVTNAVDIGIVRAGNAGVIKNCRVISAGGTGINADWAMTACSVRGSSGIGIQPGSNFVIQCEVGEATTTSLNLPNTGKGILIGNLLYDGGAVGISLAAGTSYTEIVGNTIDGMTGDGIEIPGVGTILGGSIFQNNNISNCAYGIDSSAGAQTAQSAIQSDYNNYFGNSTNNRNWITGAHDTTSDPLFVAAATDDYTPGTGSPLIQTGYTPFKSPNKLNIGAVVHGAGGGSSNATFVS